MIVNAGMPATFETILPAREFEKIGVDGIAVITPFFIQVTQDGLVRHFSAVANAVTTPVYLYDIPARTQNHIEPATAKTLAAHGNIAGIKDSAARRTRWSLSAGWPRGAGLRGLLRPDHLVVWSLQNGAKGCISGLGNVMPDTLAAIVQAFNAGDIAAAEKGAGSLRRLPQGPLHPRLSASTGEAFALPDGRLGRGQPPAGAAA